MQVSGIGVCLILACVCEMWVVTERNNFDMLVFIIIAQLFKSLWSWRRW